MTLTHGQTTGRTHGQASKRIFLTGATGSMGLAITRELIAAGHDVTGVTRSTAGARELIELGATPAEVDIFDRDALQASMAGSDVVAHFATSIPQGQAATKAASWRMNDRLRTEGTSNLIAAAEAVGARRFLFESLALAYPDRGEAWIDESTPLEPVAPMMRTAAEAERMLEAFAANGGEAVSLRFGRLYGPGRASAVLIEAMRARQMPLIGNGRNFVSSIHSEDVGTAVAAAIDVAAGTYNIVDDEPMTQRELMQMVATALKAPQPKKVPYLMARVVAGKAARVMTVSQRVSNRNFRDVTDWAPRYRSATVGWAALAAGATERARRPVAAAG